MRNTDMEAIRWERDELERLCRENDVSVLGLFGSAARGEASPDSDIDLIVRFSERKSLLDLVRIEREIAELIGRDVDLLTEASISPHLRDRIKDEMRILYDDGTKERQGLFEAYSPGH